MELFPIILLKGKPFEIGFKHGKSLKQQITTNVSAYMNMIHGYTRMKQERIMELAGKFLLILEETLPAIVEEMEGIAHGAEIPLTHVVVLNSRTELMSANLLNGECTAIGLTGKRTVDGNPLLAQNWDWIPQSKNGTAFFLLEPVEGPRALIFGEAGQVGKIGINESGLGVLLNILMSGELQLGIPVHVLLRMVLNQVDTNSAVEYVKKATRASASHFLLGDIKDNIIGLEFTPKVCSEILPTEGAIIHTNHFCDRSGVETDVTLSLLPDTVKRLERAGQLLARKERWALRELRDIFVDHENYPSSICRHVDNKVPEHLQSETIGSFVLDLPGKKIQFTHGQPCRNNYHEVSFSSKFN